MLINKKISNWAGSIFVLILTLALIIKLMESLTNLFPSIYLIGLIIIALSVFCSIVAIIITFIFRKASFYLIFCIVVSILSIILIFKFQTPSLKIFVPKGYTGKISLILSNVDKDILTVDSNGIGYITKRTFNKTITKPIVRYTNGKDISSQCVGFSPSAFWGKETTTNANTSRSIVNNNIIIQSLSFEIVPKDRQGQKQYYSNDLIRLVDRTKLLNH